jgi:hypothetical protein
MKIKPLLVNQLYDPFTSLHSFEETYLFKKSLPDGVVGVLQIHNFQGELCFVRRAENLKPHLVRNQFLGLFYKGYELGRPRWSRLFPV